MFTALTLATAFAVGAPALKSKDEPLGKGPGYMGITFSQGDAGGLVLTEVKPDGPAAKAGLKENDVLLKANDTDLKEMDTTKFVELIAGMRPNQVVTFRVMREAEALTIKVKLGPRPADFESLRPVRPPPVIDD